VSQELHTIVSVSISTRVYASLHNLVNKVNALIHGLGSREQVEAPLESEPLEQASH